MLVTKVGQAFQPDMLVRQAFQPGLSRLQMRSLFMFFDEAMGADVAIPGGAGFLSLRLLESAPALLQPRLPVYRSGHLTQPGGKLSDRHLLVAAPRRRR